MSSEIQIPTLSLDFRDFIKAQKAIDELVRELEHRLRIGQPIQFDQELDGQDPLFSIPGVYAHAKVAPTPRAQGFRDEWIEKSMDEFSLFLREPEARFPAEATATPDEFDVSHHGSVSRLRLDQIVSARGWAIEIIPNTPEICAAVATQVLVVGVRRLTNCISWIGKMISGIEKRTVNPERIEWRANDIGIRFEHLVLDILNAEADIAKRSNLFEDLFEWTDLRVHYRDIPRKSGSRVQVKLSPRDGQASPGRRLNAETHVVFGPRQLADFIDRSIEEGHHTDLLPGLWAALQSQPADSEELANALHRIFRAALEAAGSHPMGPAGSIPYAIQELSRRFVWHESAMACERMRTSVDGNPHPPSWTRRI